MTSNSFSTVARNMLLLRRWTHKNDRSEKIWPDPMKLENCTMQKSPYTLVGDRMKTSFRWSGILVAITVEDMELTPNRDFSYHSCKPLGQQGHFILKSTLKFRPWDTRISGAARVYSLHLWKTLLYLTRSLAVFTSTVITHCSPESMLQLCCAAHYPKIPGACKSVIPSKTRDLVIGSQLHTSPHEQLPQQLQIKTRTEFPPRYSSFLHYFSVIILLELSLKRSFLQLWDQPFTHQRSCLSYDAVFSICTLLCYSEKQTPSNIRRV